MENILPELITTIVVPLIAAAVVAIRKWVLSKTTPHQLQTVGQLARVAVDAAEELGVSTGLDSKNKYLGAVSFLKTSAKRVGIKLSDDEAAAFVHSTLNGKRNEIDEAVEAVLNEVLGGIAIDAPEDTEGDEEAA